MSTVRDDGVMVTMFCGPSSDNLQASFGMVALARAFAPFLVPAHLSLSGRLSLPSRVIHFSRSLRHSVCPFQWLQHLYKRQGIRPFTHPSLFSSTSPDLLHLT
jgi:hypothetical protein